MTNGAIIRQTVHLRWGLLWRPILASLLMGLAVAGSVWLGSGWSNSAIATDKNSTARLEEMPSMLTKTLDLTPAQQKKIRVISAKGRQESVPMTQELQQKRKALRVYLMSPNATEKDALHRSEQIRSLYRQLGELRLHTWFSIRKQLTPQQLKKLEHTDL